MSENPTNLYRRNGIWWARFQIDRREVRRSLRTRDGKEAKRRLKALLKKAQQARWSDEERYSYKEAIVKWTDEYLPHSVKPKTAKRYLVSAHQFESELVDLWVDEITKKTVADIVSKRRAAGATNATIRRDLTALSSIMKCCVSWGWIEENPVAAYDRSVIREHRPPVVPPSQADVDRLVRGLPGNLAHMVEFIDRTGVRLDEAAGMETWQVDMTAREILLPHTKTDCPRVIPLSDPLVAAAVGTITGTPRKLRCPWVFWHDEGKRYRRASNQIAVTVKRLMRPETPTHDRISRRFSAHDLRHKFGIDYLRAGGSIYALQKIMGHSSIQTTEMYVAYLDFESAQKAAQAQRSVAGCIDE